jgi:hypothetical protein
LYIYIYIYIYTSFVTPREGEEEIELVASTS